MKKHLWLPLVFSFLVLFPNPSREAAGSPDGRIAAIDAELARIASLVCERIEARAAKAPPFGEGHALTVYRDLATKRVRMLVYRTERTGDETGYGRQGAYVAYFDAREELACLLFHDEEGGASADPKTGEHSGPDWQVVFSGKAHFIAGKPVRVETEKRGRDADLKAVRESGTLPALPFPSYAVFRKTFSAQLQALLSDGMAGLEDAERAGFREMVTRVAGDRFRGRFRFRRPVRGDTSFVNATAVALRARPGVSAPVRSRLPLLAELTIRSVGTEEGIGAWGRHPWYEVDCGDLRGWVFGAFVTPAPYAVRE